MNTNFDLEKLKKIATEKNIDLDQLMIKAMDELSAGTKEGTEANGDKRSLESSPGQNDSGFLNISKEQMELVWEKVQKARHQDRPSTLEYIEEISDQYIELHGDRYAGDDKALIGGICTLDGVHFTFMGHQKGSNMKDNILRNYGMAHPEGYRKAWRLAKQAEHFGRPVVTFIDTSGAYPGLASEERGIGEAIAKNLMDFSMLAVPIICIIIGEGGSGGALGIGVGDKIFMMENSVYSVISPEGFASILLRDAKRAKESAVLMKMTAEHVKVAGFIDGIIPEPYGGAQEDFETTAQNIKSTILSAYDELKSKDVTQLLHNRSQKIISWTRNLDDKSVSNAQKPLLKRMREFFE